MFRLANPNTNPDGVFPIYPPMGPDGVNDLNGLPAVPWIYRDWDMDLPDPQGNVDLMYDIEAQFEWVDGEIDCSPYVSFDSPLSAGMPLAVADSFYVYIDTSELPMGNYEGWVRVFEDIPHPPGEPSPNGYWDGDEVYDTFYLEFMLVLPDLDIDDDYANMSGNEMTIEVEPGDVDVMIGEFQCYAAGPMGGNVDDWDGPGTESILDLAYYSPTNETLEKIPADGSGYVSIFPRLPGSSESIEIRLSGEMGDTLLLNGPSKLYRLRVPAVPLDLPAGTYRMDHPATWGPGDGTVPIAARGLDTGMGWLDGESGPAVVYDPTIPEVATLMDFFHLTVNVAAMVDVEFAAETWAATGDPGDVLCGDVTINNVGNVLADDVHFQAGNLIGESYGGVINSIAIGFDPASVTIELDGSATVELCVAIPAGTRADTYVGTGFLLADGETQFDEIDIEVTVNCIAGMDATATLEPITLSTETGEGAKQFTIENTGNCDLTNVGGTVDIDEGLSAAVTVDATIGWQTEEEGLVIVAEEVIPAGTYYGTVTLTADGGATDSFPLTVIVPERKSVELCEECELEFFGEAGGVIEGSVWVANTGNVSILSGIEFDVDGLTSATGAEIPADAIVFDTQTDPLDMGEEQEFSFTIEVPEGLLGQHYDNPLNLLLDGEYQDDATMIVWLERGEGYVRIFPNPVKTSESDGITIALGEYSGDLSIMVYDMFGGLVADLTAEGSRDLDVQWDLKNDDGKTVASGMYIVTIDTGDEVVTRKIMVIK
jgi:hypothetical protein